MTIIQSYPLAVVLCFVTMLCWGSWANTQKLSSKSWKFQLFYWDYSMGIILISAVLGLTLGSMGDGGRSFVADLSQGQGKAWGAALIGGAVFNIANMAVAFPVGIGLALVIGVATNYLSSPVGNPLYLGLGVALVCVAIVLDALIYKRLPGSSGKSVLKGLVLSVAAGVVMGFFYRFVAASMVTDFVIPEAGKFTPYSAMFVFSIGLFISNFIFNTWVMYKPFSGEAVKYADYFTQGNLKLHTVGLLGGLIWGTGMSLSLIASGAAGFAISYGLGQGATMVAAFWGVVIWREFKDAPSGTGKWISAMFACFIVGLALIIYARFA